MKKTNPSFLLGLAFLSALLMNSCGPWTDNGKKNRTRDFASEVKSAVSAFKWDLNGYYFRSTPVGNFGVGTIYLKEGGKKVIDPNAIASSWLLASPSTWFATTLSDNDKNELLSQLIVPGSFGSYAVTSTHSFTTSTGIEVPVISNLISTSAGVEVTKGLSLSLSADSAVNRQLAWPDFKAAVQDKKFRKPVIDAINENKYYIAAGDIIFKGFRVNIIVDKSVNPTLHAKLNDAVGKVFGKDGGGEFTLKKGSNDTFAAVSSQPVVVAVLFKEPPIQGGKGENQPPSEWKNATVNPDELQKLDAYLANKP